MLMVQGLAISYWDVLFHREIATPVAKWAYDEGTLIHTDKSLAIVFFFNTFIIFMLTYLYLYSFYVFLSAYLIFLVFDFHLIFYSYN